VAGRGVATVAEGQARPACHAPKTVLAREPGGQETATSGEEAVIGSPDGIPIKLIESRAARTRVKETTMICPRRAENPVPGNEPGPGGDLGPDGCCGYCGSLDGDAFMARVEAGDVTLDPSDKNYKVYVHNTGGDPFKQTYRTDTKPFAGSGSPEHDWVTRETQEAKFYFQHLSEGQRIRFVELLNTKALRFTDPPGRFYRLPFFISQR